MHRNLTFVLLLTVFCGVGTSFASEIYYSPERILCKLNDHGKPSCNELNRTYLIEESTNADLGVSHEETFHFSSATAYFSLNKKECSISYTYSDPHSKMVKLRTVNTTIKPAIAQGHWVKFGDYIYTCDSGYMSCPIVAE